MWEWKGSCKRRWVWGELCHLPLLSAALIVPVLFLNMGSCHPTPVSSSLKTLASISNSSLIVNDLSSHPCPVSLCSHAHFSWNTFLFLLLFFVFLFLSYFQFCLLFLFFYFFIFFFFIFFFFLFCFVLHLYFGFCCSTWWERRWEFKTCKLVSPSVWF